jgi:hypothetical protein
MDSIVDNLMQELSAGTRLSDISRTVGGTDTAVRSAFGISMPLLISSMAVNASRPNRADMVTRMLTRAGNSNLATSFEGFLNNPGAAGGPIAAVNLFGKFKPMVEDAISQKSGLPPAGVEKVMAIGTLILAGSVSKTFVQQKLDVKGVTALLRQQSKLALQSSPEAVEIATQLLASQGNRPGAEEKMKKWLAR